MPLSKRMTFRDFYDNPTGKSSAFMMNRDVAKKDMYQKYDNLKDKITYEKYVMGDRHILHFKIPSQSMDNVVYDTIIELSPQNKSMSKKDNMKGYYVRFFSNMPSFIFTYVYTLVKNKMFIIELSKYADRKAIKTRAKKRNPQSVFGFEKSTYVSSIFMMENELYKKDDNFKKIKSYKAIKDISKINEILDKYDAEKEKKRNRRRIEKDNEKREKQVKNNTHEKSNFIGTKSSNISYAKKVNKIKANKSNYIINKIKGHK